MRPDPARATRGREEQRGLRLLASLMLIIIPVSVGLVVLSVCLTPLVSRHILESAEQTTTLLLLALCIQLIGTGAPPGAYLVALLIATAFYLATLQCALIGLTWPLFLCPLAFILLSRLEEARAQHPDEAVIVLRALAPAVVLGTSLLADLLAAWWQPPLAALLLSGPATLLTWWLPTLDVERRQTITGFILANTSLLVGLCLLVGLGQLFGLARGLVTLFCCYLGASISTRVLSTNARLSLWLTLALLLLLSPYYLGRLWEPTALNWSLTLIALASLSLAVVIIRLLERRRPAPPR
ncbi:hypothetical protein [Thermogemmatispora sp.]|uniref:hypothetical protein n=1 Tax=Thermogemmatispora sp. TaxID=1968838 RepID=UPI001D8EDD67|nr:hypothetical protein [Thermogemmatispora sp.]MBX5449804.1 hypothetical protein [Thermogemmatispora sp.]